MVQTGKPMSRRGLLRLAQWTFFGTAGCLVVSLTYNFFAFRHLGPEALFQGLVSATILPIVLAGPLFVYLTMKMRELAIANHRLSRAASTDGLTGCLNRGAFTAAVEAMLGIGSGESPRGALFVVDADQFKRINDRFGHDVGDRVLQEMALRLAGRVRTQDLVARYAGDEFLVVLDAMAERADAQLVRQNLERALHEPLASLAALDAGDFPHGASIGLAMYPDDGQDVDTLIRVADADMYRRKSADDEQAQ